MAGRTILVVEDEPDIRQLYSLWLKETYDVEHVGEGTAATERCLDAIDIVILDRNLPGLCGDAVASTLTSNGYEGMIAIVSARDPDPPIATLPVDEYLTKPIEKRELMALVDRLLTRLQAPADLRALFAMYTRKTRLEATLSDSELVEHPAYRRLCSRIDSQLASVLDRDVESINTLARETLPDAADFEAIIDSSDRGPEGLSTAAGAGQEL